MSRLQMRWRVQYKRPDQHEYKDGTALYDRDAAHRLAQNKPDDLMSRVVREERRVEAVYGDPDTPTEGEEA